MTTPTTFSFTKAVKNKEKLRLALDGPAGAGKTWTALTIGSVLADHETGRVAVIDSERSSAKKYAPYFDFDHLELPDFSPHTYTAAIRAAVDAGYAVIIIDSLSHAWEGTLELKDDVARRSKSHDSFGAWREVTPVHNDLVDTMLRAPAHVIATMRTNTEYLVERDDATGKNKVSKVGLAPVQRKGVDYEFDVVGDMDLENTLTVSKTRCHELAGEVIRKPGADFAGVLWRWLDEGDPVASREQVDELVGLMNDIGDPDLRKNVKQAFVTQFGRPEHLTAERVEAAKVWVIEQAMGPAKGSADRPGDDADRGHGEAPDQSDDAVTGEAGDVLADDPGAADSARRRECFALMAKIYEPTDDADWKDWAQHLADATEMGILPDSRRDWSDVAWTALADALRRVSDEGGEELHLDSTGAWIIRKRTTRRTTRKGAAA